MKIKTTDELMMKAAVKWWISANKFFSPQEQVWQSILQYLRTKGNILLFATK